MAAELMQIAEKLRARGDGGLAQHFINLADIWPRGELVNLTQSSETNTGNAGSLHKGIKGWMRDTTVAEEITKARGDYFLDHTKLGLMVTYHPNWWVREAAAAAITDVRENGIIALSNIGVRYEAVLRLHQSGVRNSIDLRKLVDTGKLQEVKGIGTVLEGEIVAKLSEFEERLAAWRASLKPLSSEVNSDIGDTDQPIPQSSLPKWECPTCGESVRVGIRGDLDLLCGPCTRQTMTEVRFVRSVNVRQYHRKD